MKFIILHGTGGNPEENWFPWLAGELEKLGRTTVRPQLPTPQGQTPESWLTKITETVAGLGGPDDETIFVAHSMSPAAVCYYLTTISTPIRVCFFVAGFSDPYPLDIEPFQTVNPPFTKLHLDWAKVRANCQKFICIAGDDDPYVPQEILKKFADHLQTELILVPGGKHLSASGGYTQFPQLLDLITSNL